MATFDSHIITSYQLSVIMSLSCTAFDIFVFYVDTRLLKVSNVAHRTCIWRPRWL